jgi:RNA polymerase sigma-70 factor (ECF subfamily)
MTAMKVHASRRTEAAEAESAAAPDAEVVRRVLAGEREAYAVLVARYLPIVKAFLSGRGVRRTDLDDAAQAAFVITFEQLGRLRRPERVSCYLLTVAARQVRRRRRATVSLHDVPEPAESKPEQPAPGEDCAAALEAAVARLPQAMQAALGLKYHEGLPVAEIARRLGQSVGSVTKTLSRAYARLRSDRTLRNDLESK